MRKIMETGMCRICNREKPLSFEHIPPRAVFNNRPVITLSLQETIAIGPDLPTKGPIKQKGMGDYVLCEECNNNTGSWYASRFVDWCYRGMEILKLSSGNPSLVYNYRIHPLPVLKQIVVMFLAVNRPGFAKVQKELAHFVLNKEETQLPPKFNVYTYYNIVGLHRNIGLSGKLNLPTGKMMFMSEVSFPPFGYLLSINSDKPDDRLVDITDFANYSYDDIAEIQMKMAVLPTYLIYPGDYRSREEIHIAKESNRNNSA